LLAFHNELTVIALIGIILLIGIVKKKNAIMMIDFAIEEERKGKTPRRIDLPGLPAEVPSDHDDTMAALFGGLPLALSPAQALNAAARWGSAS